MHVVLVREEVAVHHAVDDAMLGLDLVLHTREKLARVGNALEQIALLRPATLAQLRPRRQHVVCARAHLLSVSTSRSMARISAITDSTAPK